MLRVALALNGAFSKSGVPFRASYDLDYSILASNLAFSHEEAGMSPLIGKMFLL